MRRGRRAGFAAALVIAAAAVVASGCGGGSSSRSALKFDPVSAAVTKTAKAGAARATFSFSLSSPMLAGGKAINIGGHGIVDGRDADLTVDMGSMFSKLGAPSATPSTLREILLEEHGDSVFYLSFGGIPVLHGKSWLRVDMTQAYKKMGFNLNSFASPGSFDPSQLMQMLKGIGTVQKLGSEMVDGVATTHYRAKIDFAKLVKTEAAGNPALQGLLASTGLKTVPEDVWIGRENLLRRLTTAFSMHMNGVSLRMRMRVDLSDYGIKASVTAPPSSDVYDGTQLAEHGFAGAFH